MRERHPRGTLLLLVLALGLVERASRAEQPEDAFVLFQEGRELSARGDYAGACTKFAASLALRPTLGTRLNLGDCAEHMGQVATARAHFLEAVAMAGREGDATRAEYATGRAGALAGRIPHLVLRGVPSSSDARLRIDGVVAQAGEGPLDASLDPGDHELSIETPGRETWSRKVHLDEGAPPLVVDVPPPPEPSPAANRPVAPVASDAGAPARETRWPWQRTAGLALAGVGVAGLGIGTFYGLDASSQWSDAKKNCPHLPACTARGVQDTSDAKQSASLSTLSFGIGLAAVAAGAALWWTAPAADNPPASRPLAAAPLVGTREAGLLVRGEF